MTQCMFYLAKGGKYTLIKDLLEKTDWHFHSIMDMPKVFYVEGYLPDNREKIDKLSLVSRLNETTSI